MMAAKSLLVVWAIITSVAAAPAPTSIRPTSPLDAHNRLAAGFTIQHRYGDANCESGSPTTGTAYQCFSPQSAQGIFNSCWVQAQRKYVICLVKPWMRKVVRLHVTRGFGDSNGFLHAHTPWGLRIGQHTRCLVDLGSVHSAQGHAITYTCNKRVVLAGPVRRGSAVWRIRSYRKIHHKGHSATYRSLGIQPATFFHTGTTST